MRKFVLSAVACLVFPSVVAACDCAQQQQFFVYRAPVIERQVIREKIVEVPARIVEKQRVVRQRFFVPRANFRSVERIRSNY